MKLVKDKIYASAVNPEQKNDRHLQRVKLNGAINYDSFEQNKEIQLVNGEDVFVPKGDE